MTESLGVQPNPTNLSGLLEVVDEVVLGVLGQPLHRRGRTQRPSLQKLERRLDDELDRFE